jgi:hypothetical protein
MLPKGIVIFLKRASIQFLQGDVTNTELRTKHEDGDLLADYHNILTKQT